MKELITWYGLKRHPFDKGIRTTHVFESDPLKEAEARLDYVRRRGGIMLLTGDPGVGKTLALRRFADSLNETRFRPVYTPLTTLRGTDILRHVDDLPARTTPLSAAFPPSPSPPSPVAGAV